MSVSVVTSSETDVTVVGDQQDQAAPAPWELLFVAAQAVPAVKVPWNTPSSMNPLPSLSSPSP